MKQSREDIDEDPIVLFKAAFASGQEALRLYYDDDNNDDKDDVRICMPEIDYVILLDL